MDVPVALLQELLATRIIHIQIAWTLRLICKVALLCVLGDVPALATSLAEGSMGSGHEPLELPKHGNS